MRAVPVPGLPFLYAQAMRTNKTTLPALKALMILTMLAGMLPDARAEGFMVTDPRGDDFGAGDLVYPNRDDMDKGSLDLERIEVEHRKDGTWFKVRLGRKIPDPKGQLTYVGKEPLQKLARHGFYTFNIDIYVDRDRVVGSGRTDTLPGRKMSVSQNDAWEKAIVLTPRPKVARAYYSMFLEREREKAIEAEKGRVDREDVLQAQEDIQKEISKYFFFPEQISVTGRTIRFFVPDSFLGESASPEWGYSVLVTGCEVEQLSKVVELTPGEFNLMVIPAARGRHRDRFGIVNDSDGNQPPVIDVLAPSIDEQKRMLSDYDTRVDRLAAARAISPAGTISEGGVTGSGGTVAMRTPSRAVGGSGGFSGVSPRPSVRPAPVPVPTDSPEARRTIPARLKTLNTLRDDGLISNDEYLALRRKILSEI